MANKEGQARADELIAKARATSARGGAPKASKPPPPAAPIPSDEPPASREEVGPPPSVVSLPRHTREPAHNQKVVEQKIAARLPGAAHNPGMQTARQQHAALQRDGAARQQAAREERAAEQRAAHAGAKATSDDPATTTPLPTHNPQRPEGAPAETRASSAPPAEGEKDETPK